jgi:tetratricopeptide (TPR) repeat protein
MKRREFILYAVGALGVSSRKIEADHHVVSADPLVVALTIDPQDAEGYFWRAKLLAGQGARREAIADLKSAVELKPDYSEAYTELAKLYTADGQPQQAASAIKAHKKIRASSNPAAQDQLLKNLPDALR